MKLSDTASGPEWAPWLVLAGLAIIAIILLSGHGSGLIAGYNTKSAEEKAKYDKVKLARVTGAGLVVIILMMLIMILFEDVLPSFSIAIVLAVIVADVIAINVAAKKLCMKKKDE